MTQVPRAPRKKTAPPTQRVRGTGTKCTINKSIKTKQWGKSNLTPLQRLSWMDKHTGKQYLPERGGIDKIGRNQDLQQKGN